MTGAGKDGSLHDGLAMALASGGSALVGMLGWILAARVLDTAELGLATAFVSAFLLIAGATELNVGIGLLRWLPGAGGSSRRLLVTALGAVAALSGTVAALYLLLPGTAVIIRAVTGTAPSATANAAGVGLFVLTAVLYALFQQQDFVLVGLGRPWWAPTRTLLFAVGRLGIVLAAGASLTTEIVVLSWVAPLLACVALVGLQAVVLTRRRRRAPGRLPALREAAGFLGPTYLGQVATSVLFNQVPLLVVLRFGPEVGGRFFLVWQAVTVVDVLATYFAASLAAGVAREPGRADELSRAVRRRLLVLVGPALVLGALLAEPVLALFGPAYTAEAWVLRILLLGLGLRLLVVHRLAEHQAHGRGLRFARLATATTVGVVAVVALVPAGPADPLVTFAVGFVGVQVLAAGAVLLRRRRDPAPLPRPTQEPEETTTVTEPLAAAAPVLVTGRPRTGARVAVCIPVHQGGRHLAATLRSVLDQDVAGLEVVVLDNASTDETPAVLAGFDDARLTVWRHDETVDMVTNFRRVVALSHAPLVKILPADDLLEPGCLASAVAAFDADPGLALVVGRKHLVDEHGRVLARGRFLRGLAGVHSRPAVVRRVVRSGANPIGADAAATFRRDAYDAVGGYPDDAGLADLDLWLRLLEHGRFLGQTATVARFRVSGQAASAATHRRDYRAQRAFTADIARRSRPVVRRRDVVAGRVHAPLARRRRELLYAVAGVSSRLRSV
ncbi:glycosyltransferase [Actinomycetospora chiangmaiensis]|uniref:glycosyltransferase n=1 Tax=Actinomycetospora chiangmaiensis TaxID=402650 RepID=UPI00035F31AB|nr:glycosyltransferase [Actinomycetospora chiangmaiensis]